MIYIHQTKEYNFDGLKILVVIRYSRSSFSYTVLNLNKE